MLPCRFVSSDLNQTVKGRKRFVDEVYIKKLEVDDINVESVVPDNIVCNTISCNTFNSDIVGVGVNYETCSISSTSFEVRSPLVSVHMNSGDTFEVVNNSNDVRMLYSNGVYTEAYDLRAYSVFRGPLGNVNINSSSLLVNGDQSSIDVTSGNVENSVVKINKDGIEMNNCSIVNDQTAGVLNIGSTGLKLEGYATLDYGFTYRRTGIDRCTINSSGFILRSTGFKLNHNNLDIVTLGLDTNTFTKPTTFVGSVSLGSDLTSNSNISTSGTVIAEECSCNRYILPNDVGNFVGGSYNTIFNRIGGIATLSSSSGDSTWSGGAYSSGNIDIFSYASSFGGLNYIPFAKGNYIIDIETKITSVSNGGVSLNIGFNDIDGNSVLLGKRLLYYYSASNGKLSMQWFIKYEDLDAVNLLGSIKMTIEVATEISSGTWNRNQTKVNICRIG